LIQDALVADDDHVRPALNLAPVTAVLGSPAPRNVVKEAGDVPLDLQAMKQGADAPDERHSQIGPVVSIVELVECYHLEGELVGQQSPKLRRDPMERPPPSIDQ
jgi:hypothetical protein